MYKVNKQYTQKEKKLLVYTILSMLVLTVILIFNVFHFNNVKHRDIEVTINFIKLFNFIVSVFGVVSCYISYNRIRNHSIFIISLMYLGLATGILFGHIDFLPFYHEQLEVSTYIIISSSLLRIFFLILAVMPENKVSRIIINNKIISLFGVVIFTIILGNLEGILMIKFNWHFSYNLFKYYNIFLGTIYILSSLLLLIKAFVEEEYIFVVLSASILVLGIKAIYAIYMSSELTFYSKLMSVSLTYISILILIIGALIEQFMHTSRVNRLNDNLKLFYNLSENDMNSSRLVFDENINILYANKKIREALEHNDNNCIEIMLKQKVKYLLNREDIILSLETQHFWSGVVDNEENNKIINCFIQIINNTKNKKQIAITYIDISEEVKNELEVKKLKIYDQEKTEFIANISHELKTPLNMFYSSVQLMDKFIDENDVDFRKLYSRYNNALHTNCERMTRLINNIMDLSKMDLGIMNTNFKNYNIVEVIEDVTLSVIEYASLKGINIIFDTNEEEQIIKCDANMIERIMLNLLSNAIKFSKENSNIIVNIFVDSEWVKIEVIDEGIGISEDNLNIIFDKFIQLDKSFTRQNEGSGIGLSIVKSLVNIHGGNILVESNLDKGSKFKVFLPNIKERNDNFYMYNIDKYNTKLELSDIYELTI